MNSNRKFKDSVFTALFNDPDLLRELYCALEGVSLPPDTPVSINTLENVLFMDLYNGGKNESVIKRCKKLAEYSSFIAKTRTFLDKTMDKEEAVREAVKYCQKHDILKVFLEKHASEVLNMLITEWNWDDAKEIWQAEAREEGLEEGLEKGRKEALELLAKKDVEIAHLRAQLSVQNLNLQNS